MTDVKRATPLRRLRVMGLHFFLQRDLYIALAVMGWCARVPVWHVCATKSAQGVGKLILVWWKSSMGEAQKCQNGVRNLDSGL